MTVMVVTQLRRFGQSDKLKIETALTPLDPFGILKENYGFRRFLVRGKQNIETQFFLLAFAFNIEKLCNRAKKERKGQHLFCLDKD
jgi:hypothetical protein